MPNQALPALVFSAPVIHWFAYGERAAISAREPHVVRADTASQVTQIPEVGILRPSFGGTDGRIVDGALDGFLCRHVYASYYPTLYQWVVLSVAMLTNWYCVSVMAAMPLSYWSLESGVSVTLPDAKLLIAVLNPA